MESIIQFAKSLVNPQRQGSTKDFVIDSLQQGIQGIKQNAKNDINLMTDKARQPEMQKKAYEDSYKMAKMMALSGPTKNAYFGYPQEKLASSMIPTRLRVMDEAGNLVKNTKAYTSLRKAIDVGTSQLELPKGGQAWPEQLSRHIDTLLKRFKDLKSSGYSTTNVEKAIKEEMVIVKRALEIAKQKK